jgi:SAM-dependent methyltransferase
MAELPEHVRRNRALWDEWAEKYAASGERGWAEATPTWGIWSVPESQVGMLPDDLAGQDAIELGCGTAYVSAWMARRGARVVGIDNSELQLATARRLQGSTGSNSRCSTATQRRSPTPTRASTSRSRSTARACGPIPGAGCPRRRGCCGRAGGSSSSPTPR